MGLQSIIKSGGAKRLILLAGALLLAALTAIPASNVDSLVKSLCRPN